VQYVDGAKGYILAPDGLKAGMTVLSSKNADITPGNALRLRFIPVGTMLHNVELKIGKGGQLVRSAGAAAQLMAKDGDYAQVRLPSGEVRMVHLRLPCLHRSGLEPPARARLARQGRSYRWLGRRPHNRGVAMNPVDHPMGGGEGRTSGGRHPCSPWGQLSKGKKTRTNKATTSSSSRTEVRRSDGSTQSKKGPFVDDHLAGEGRQGGQAANDRKMIKTWSRRSTITPEFVGLHLRRAQRPEVHHRVRHREHGRPQARRVRARRARSTVIRPTKAKAGPQVIPCDPSFPWASSLAIPGSGC
jgi:hypothetical protein